MICFVMFQSVKALFKTRDSGHSLSSKSRQKCLRIVQNCTSLYLHLDSSGNGGCQLQIITHELPQINRNPKGAPPPAPPIGQLGPVRQLSPFRQEIRRASGPWHVRSTRYLVFIYMKPQHDEFEHILVPLRLQFRLQISAGAFGIF